MTLTRRRLLRLLPPALAVSAGCADTAERDRPAVDTVVRMTSDLVFEPARVVVAVDDAVGWQTVGQPEHTVTAYEEHIPDSAGYFASGGFESEDAAREGFPGGSVEATEWYTHTFEVPGTYEYFCVPHERTMTGTVVVEA